MATLKAPKAEKVLKTKASITFKADRKFIAQLDNWRRKQSPIPSRSEAIRSLVQQGIGGGGGPKGKEVW